MANPSQIFLLADHIKLSLLERQRAISLNLDASAQDGTISRSLESMRESVEAVEKEASRQEENSESSASTARDQATKLRAQYSELHAQFTSSPAAPVPSSLTSPNDPSLSSDFAAAQTIPPKTPQSSLRLSSTQSPLPTSKSVRFRDNPSAQEDEELAANRAALFPYRDDPAANEGINQDDMSNQQIHAYHAQVLREQDDHLDRLGKSIGRQRDLSIQIGDELEEQIAMLDEVEGHVDRHQGRLDGARDRIGRIARKANDNKQITTIVVLIVILVLLIVVLK